MNIKNFKTTTIVAILVAIIFIAEYTVTIYIQTVDLKKVRISGAYKFLFQIVMVFLIDH